MNIQYEIQLTLLLIEGISEIEWLVKKINTEFTTKV